MIKEMVKKLRHFFILLIELMFRLREIRKINLFYILISNNEKK